MSFSRLISPTARAALLVAVGSLLIVVPFALGLSVAAVATAAAVGVLAIGLGLAGTAYDGRGTLPLSAHAAYDRGLAIGLLVVAVTFGAVGEIPALIFFAVAGLIQLVLGGATRYSARTA